MSRDINNKYWDEELETLPRAELEKRQLADLQEIVPPRRRRRSSRPGRSTPSSSESKAAAASSGIGRTRPATGRSPVRSIPRPEARSFSSTRSRGRMASGPARSNSRAGRRPS